MTEEEGQKRAVEGRSCKLLCDKHVFLRGAPEAIKIDRRLDDFFKFLLRYN